MTEFEKDMSSMGMKNESAEVKSSLGQEIYETAQEIEPELVQIYEDLHAHPELGGQETYTAARVKEYLESLGIDILGENIGQPVTRTVEGEEETVNGTGIVARIRGQEGGPTVALRADMDALPFKDNDGKPFNAHACGHDTHTTGLLGAAKILSNLASEGKLKGNAILLFQPSEEKSSQKESGAVQMVKFLEKEGLRSQIGAFFGLHVFRSMERGMIRLKEGVDLASSAEIDVKLKAPGGHVLNSYEVPNLKELSANIDSRLFAIFGPMKAKGEALVSSTFTKFDSTAYNSLSASADSTWVVRIPTEQYKETSRDIQKEVQAVVDEEVAKHLEQVGKGDISVEVKPRAGYRPVIHRDPELVRIAKEAAEESMPNMQMSPDSDKILYGGEDFSFYLEELNHRQIPGAYVLLGGANREKGILPGNHHIPDFKVDPDVTVDMAALYADFAQKAMKYLSESMKEEA